MARIYTTEITSEEITSDNPIHQRLFKAYVVGVPYMKGDVLEVGCGEGRGIELLMKHAGSFTAVDKIKPVIDRLQQKHPGARLISMNIPPLTGLHDEAFDVVVSFQVIEHIEDDRSFLQEIHRVLKPGGTALLTTPNRSLSLTRNPWHIREYLPHELRQLAGEIFAEVDMKGITGNSKVMTYYEENRKSVERFTKWDFFNLQHRIPARLLRIPYEVLNRWNRNKLQSSGNELVKSIRHEDYLLTDDPTNALDLLLIAKKHT
ncbi:MAG: class I SAM-dependent methyltransferase [Bacteroidota bacterium]|nr:class I SAM-dependent methyltransferase [Bacteroidota bacterium]